MILVLAALGYAQEAPDQAFRLDPVFVSVFRSPDPALKARAREVERRLVAALGSRHLVVPLEDVPPFEDYSAEVYLTSCPEGRESGCAYVVGGRAGADWAISGVVTSAGGSAVVVDTTLVDVRDARTVVRFQTTVAADIGPYAGAVADLVDRVSEEGSGPVDIRPGEATADFNERRKQEEAEAILEMERQLGSLVVRERDAELVAPKMTAADLEALRGREGAMPWEQYGLSPGQYRLLMNRGDDVESFRARLAGRQGRLLVRGVVGGGSGPWTVRYDGRWVVDPAENEIVEVAAFRELVGGGAGGGGVEAAFGILPWLDAGVYFESWVGQYRWLLHPETLGDARTPDEETVTPAGSAWLGPRATVAFFPARTVRPLASLGLSWWLGPPLSRVADIRSVAALDPVPAPVVTALVVGGGVEVETSNLVSWFARLEFAATLSGGEPYTQVEGEPALVYTTTPEGGPALGARVSGGIQLQTPRLFGGPR